MYKIAVKKVIFAIILSFTEYAFLQEEVCLHLGPIHARAATAVKSSLNYAHCPKHLKLQ